MTQMPGTQDVAIHLNPSSVVNYFGAMQSRDQSFLQNIKQCKETVLEAAQLYADERDDAKLQKLREQLLALVEAEQQVQAHQAALSQVASSYRPTMETTDFQELMQERMHEVPTMARPDRDEDVQEFDGIAGLTAADAGDDLDSDEDLVVVNTGVEKNEKCPYTMKLLIDLDEPVEDHKGFVYEGAAIRAQITRNHGQIECPVAGASHFIRRENLKPCRRIIRLQKARAKNPAAGQHGQTQNPAAAAGGRVLDI